MRFLDVTLDTYQDTSGYMYLGLFKQNYKDEWCAWKRFARDGRHFRVLEHTTGYFYQEGFLPSQTEAGEEEDEKEEADDADDAPTSSRQPRRRRETRELRHLLRLLRHLRHLRQLPRQLRQLPWRPRSRPGAHPRAAASRARDTYPRMYPYVSDMYRECIFCVMYLRVKIHCILNVS